MKRQLLLFLFAGFIFSAVVSQNSSVIVTGKITGDKSEPLEKASVKIKNGNGGTVCDSKGDFRLSVASLPVTLLISYSGFDPQEITVNGNEALSVMLQPAENRLDELHIIAAGDKRFSGKAISYPGSIEIISNKEIGNSPLPPHDLLAAKKGVSVTTSSLTFKTPSTRGFNGSGSTRVNQIVDGMDNQAPGLNFFVGNFAGLSDLDVENIELLPGASSALYGPGGMNGTVLINSKSPFKYPGLSVIVKPGIMNVGNSPRGKTSAYHDYSFRYAKNFNDKFAFKVGAQFIIATDWLANDSTNYLRSGTSGKLVGGNRRTDPNYDGVNVYGDETTVNMLDVTDGVLAFATQQFVSGFRQVYGTDPTQAQINGFLSANPQTQPFYLGKQAGIIPDQNVSRTGYAEKDIIDPETRNIKLYGSLHYKITDKLEAQLMANWATGNTVYTDDNRYALKGIKIGQYKFELKSRNWFLRSYTTQEDAGEAYSATVATQYFNEAWKKSQQWYPEYVGMYVGAISAGASPAAAHNMARDYADQGRPVAGSGRFRQLFDSVRNVPLPNGGLLKEKSQLWMTEGQYSFGDATRSAEIIIGGSYKRYILNSGGTLFIDTLKPISINETGAYAQVTRKLFNEKLTLTASGRMDKNENFKAQFTPRFAAVINVAKDNNLRMSYQTAYRFPGNLSQWIRLDVGGDYLLLGGLPWVMDYMNASKNSVHLIHPDGTIESTPYVYKEFKPETMNSFEIGYKSLINKKLLIDAYAYFGKYEDFIGRIGLYQPATGEAFSIVTNSVNKVKTHGYGLGIDYRMSNNFSVFGNAYSDVITDVPAGFKSYFNTPKYRFNAGFANSGFGKDDRLNFNVMMRWQDSFNWEGELANGPLDAFTTVDAQVGYKFPKVKSTVRLGGSNIFNNYYKNAYANPQIGGLYYASFIYNL